MAANDFIHVSRSDPNATEALELLGYKNTLRAAYEIGVRIRDKMRHCFSDAGGTDNINWSTVEALWGIPAGSTSVGPTANGSKVFTFVDGSIGAMEGLFQNSQAKDFTSSVG